MANVFLDFGLYKQGCAARGEYCIADVRNLAWSTVVSADDMARAFTCPSSTNRTLLHYMNEKTTYNLGHCLAAARA